MSIRKIAALQMGLLLAAMLANAAASKDMVSKDTVRITVLDSVTRALTPDNNGVPQNCEQLTFDAYCRSTTNVPLLSTLLVQEDNQPPFRISCTVESKYSRCVPLPKGESFDAKREKRGITVYYVDDKGKERKQLYTLVASDAKASQPAAAAAVATQQVPAAAAPRQNPPVPAPAPSVGSVQAAPPEKVERVKCNFSSTPPGAEITLDGKFVGSTPSEITVTTGTHVVAFSMPGFAPWQRDLTVIPGSELTVSAILQKQSQ
jgi:PEGA domain-containing protein